jgi:O-antigen ligase
MLAILGGALAIVGIAQKAMPRGVIYGFWTPTMNGSIFGPFVNKNHFAGWMVMALPVVLGWLWAMAIKAGPTRAGSTIRDYVLWLGSPAANQMLLTIFAMALMTLSLFMTLSRSGIVAFVVAVVVIAGHLVRQREAGARRFIGPVYVAALVVFAIATVGVETISARFGNGDAATLNLRLPIWHDALRVASDFPLVGSGVNTFGDTMLLYQTALPEVHVREAHNDYLQLAVEGGILFAAALVVAVIAFIRVVRTRLSESHGSSYWIRLGAVTGLLAIALQSVLEFSLQMPGNAALFVVLCALALHQPLEASPRSRPARRPA